MATGKAQPRKYSCGSCNGSVTCNHTGQGTLGTWSCVNKCRKRQLTTPRFIGSGKESERKRLEPHTRLAPIAIKVTL